MAHRASLVLLRLVVERGHSRCAFHRTSGRRVALQTEQVDLTALQQTWVRGPVRGMAGYATLGSDPMVLEDKRPGLVHMTLEANLVLRDSRAQLLGEEAAVLIMAIRALHQALVHTVPERLAEVRLGFQVAGEA